MPSVSEIAEVKTINKLRPSKKLGVRTIYGNKSGDCFTFTTSKMKILESVETNERFNYKRFTDSRNMKPTYFGMDTLFRFDLAQNSLICFGD